MKDSKAQFLPGYTLLLICLLLAPWRLFAVDALESGRSSDAVDPSLLELSRRLDKDCSECVTRNSNGQLYALKLRGTNVSTAALAAVATSHTIEQLTVYNNPGESVTKEGLAYLATMSRLRSLSIRCNGALPTDVFDEMTKLTQLRRLELVSAFPLSHDYSSISRLTNLGELIIFGDQYFGDVQLHILTNSVTLNTIKLQFTGVSKEAAVSLKSTISNVVVINRQWRVVQVADDKHGEPGR